MAISTKKDEFGNIISLNLNNPAFGNVSPLNLDIPIPDIGEVFDIGGTLAVRSGNTITQLAPDYTANPGIKPIDFLSQQKSQLLSQLGISSDKVRSFNPGDIYQAGFTKANSSLFDPFIQGYKATGTGSSAVTRTGGEGSNVDLSNEQVYNIESSAGRIPKLSSWTDPATGQVTPAGVGIPSNSMGTYINNEADLEAKRQILRNAKIPENEWTKYISLPGKDGKLYFKEPTKLTSPNGQTKTVATGSTEANGLLKSGWTIGGGVDSGTITSGLLTPETDINIGDNITSNTYNSDVATASALATSKSIEDLIKYYQQLLTPEESDLSKQVEKLFGEVSAGATSLTGRGATQLAEEQKRGIEQKNQLLTEKNTLLKTKLAEINALTTSYQTANQTEEGRPQTLSRLQGAQAQNYKMYLAQKNGLASEAGILQAEILGMQGELESAQNATDRAVDLLYSDRESAYNAKLAQLNILQPQLEKEEAKYATALKIVLQQQADALAEQKQNKKNILSVKMDAINSGITNPIVLNNINNAKSINEALNIFATNIPKKIVSGEKPKTTGGGGGTSQPTISITKSHQQQIQNNLSSVRGGDGYVSPDNYKLAREDWINAGGNPTNFDTKMKGFRNPNNKNYLLGEGTQQTTKTTEISETSDIDLQKLMAELNTPWWKNIFK